MRSLLFVALVVVGVCGKTPVRNGDLDELMRRAMAAGPDNDAAIDKLIQDAVALESDIATLHRVNNSKLEEDIGGLDCFRFGGQCRTEEEMRAGCTRVFEQDDQGDEDELGDDCPSALTCCQNPSTVTAGLEFEFAEFQLTCKNGNGPKMYLYRTEGETLGLPLLQFTSDMGSKTKTLELITGPRSINERLTWIHGMTHLYSVFITVSSYAAQSNVELPTIINKINQRNAKLKVPDSYRLVPDDRNTDEDCQGTELVLVGGFPSNEPVSGGMQCSVGIPLSDLPHTDALKNTYAYRPACCRPLGEQMHYLIDVAQARQVSLTHLQESVPPKVTRGVALRDFQRDIISGFMIAWLQYIVTEVCIQKAERVVPSCGGQRQDDCEYELEYDVGDTKKWKKSGIYLMDENTFEVITPVAVNDKVIESLNDIPIDHSGKATKAFRLLARKGGISGVVQKNMHVTLLKAKYTDVYRRVISDLTKYDAPKFFKWFKNLTPNKIYTDFLAGAELCAATSSPGSRFTDATFKAKMMKKWMLAEIEASKAWILSGEERFSGDAAEGLDIATRGKPISPYTVQYKTGVVFETRMGYMDMNNNFETIGEWSRQNKDKCNFSNNWRSSFKMRGFEENVIDKMAAMEDDSPGLTCDGI